MSVYLADPPRRRLPPPPRGPLLAPHQGSQTPPGQPGRRGVRPGVSLEAQGVLAGGPGEATLTTFKSFLFFKKNIFYVGDRRVQLPVPPPPPDREGRGGRDQRRLRSRVQVHRMIKDDKAKHFRELKN